MIVSTIDYRSLMALGAPTLLLTGRWLFQLFLSSQNSTGRQIFVRQFRSDSARFLPVLAPNDLEVFDLWVRSFLEEAVLCEEAGKFGQHDMLPQSVGFTWILAVTAKSLRCCVDHTVFAKQGRC
jgi:hypothetical protein